MCNIKWSLINKVFIAEFSELAFTKIAKRSEKCIELDAVKTNNGGLEATRLSMAFETYVDP